MSILEVNGLSAGYGTQAAVSDVNLHVEPGEIVALLGANGAGKSTTLKAISGTIPVLKGEVRVAGRPETAPLYRRARQGLSYVTEERSVFKALSVADNLRVGGVGGVGVEEALKLFPELEKRLKIRAGLISGGEQQMLTLARALARQPKLLLADELSLGLAPMVVTRLFVALRAAAAESNTGVLLVEQHVRKALHYVDRVYVMRRGRIAMSVTVEEAHARVHEIEQAYLTTSEGAA